MSCYRFCLSCTREVPTAQNADGFISCIKCGLVLDENIYTDDVTFSNNAAAQAGSVLGGSNVNSVQGEQSASRETTLNMAYETILDMVTILGMAGGDLIAKLALRLYEVALDKNFVQGRRAEQVAAVCLYISCRDVLGAVYLQLCKELHLQEHPMLLKLVDPTLFICRFSFDLLGNINPEVENTALRILTSMKRDWMQVKVVHVCEATLTKRSIESGSLTIEEFDQKAAELGNDVTKYFIKGNVSKDGELLCKHKGSGGGDPHGLCEACYDEFITISRGLDEGSEPPAS